MRRIGKNLLRMGVVLAGTAIFAIPSALADDSRPKGVVELFTSQGCSSCPPADAALGKLVEQGDVVALGYHVDYWNYLGWKDTFSSEENTERQYDYAKTLGRKSVYTPQAVLNGRDHLNGADLRGINATLESFRDNGKGLTVPVTAARDGDRLKIHIGEGSGKANIVVVYFDNRNTVDVERGENRGRKLTYWHSVRDVQTVGMWDGKAMDLVLPVSVMDHDSYDGCAILVQKMKSATVPGPIVGASVVMDSSS
jgi:hypothetical protein